jgi:DNA-binding CsgD family transcriptional regulator
MSEYFDEANETMEQLKMLIGKESALKVYKLFEGENIYFPKRIGLAELHSQIYAELQEGKSYGELARKYGYSKSYIRKIEHKIIQKRRAMRKAGGAPPEPATAPHAEPVNIPVFAKPRDNAFPQARPFKQGELFYDGQ